MGQTISIFYPASGGSDDWGYDIMLEAKRYQSDTFLELTLIRPNPLSYTFELRDKGKYGFLLPADQIKENCQEVDAAIHAMLNHIKNRN